MDAWVMASIIGEAIRAYTWFSGGWFLVYVILGPWPKARLARGRTDDSLPLARRRWPVFVSHLLFSACFVNPYTLLYAAFKLDGFFDSWVGTVALVAAYFWVLPMLLEGLFLRLIPRLRWLGWFRWNPPLKRAILISLLISTLAFGGGLAGIYMKDVWPSVVRAFPLRPKAFAWKVKTGATTLVNHSLATQPDRMLIDDRYVYVHVRPERHEWRVVDRTTREVLGKEAEALGYVRADDGGDTWQIKGGSEELLCGRALGESYVAVPVAAARDVVFLSNQVHGMIIGANPGSGQLFAFDPESGEVSWTVTAPAHETNRDKRIGSLSVADDVLGVGLWMSRTWAVDVESGATLWEDRADNWGNSMYVVASADLIIGFSRSKTAYAYDPRTGARKWTTQVGNLAGGVGEGKVCLFGDRLIYRNKDAVRCIALGTGNELQQWRFGDHWTGGVDCSSEGVVACASDRTLVLFDLETGEERLRTRIPIRGGIRYGFFCSIKKTPGRVYAGPVYAETGEVFVFTDDGVLWALRPGP